MHFRLWLENEFRIRFAHVGASRNINNPERGLYGVNDSWHMDVVVDWLFQNDPDFLQLARGHDNDFIDLNDGRDFLEENQKYDIVILHMVYNPPPELIQQNKRYGQGNIFRISQKHSAEAWRRRLVSTGARYIFAFGSHGDEVDGRYLGPLSGYHGPIETQSDCSIYIKDQPV